jgi:prefoldin alpha subunit
MAINEEQERARLSYEVQVYREQLRLLEREIERINLTAVDLSNALRTLENLKNEDVMVPIGGGAFIKASVYTTKVLVPAGADYITEMEREKAVAELKKRVESTKKAFEKLSEQFTQISKKLQEVGIRLTGMSRKSAASDDKMSEAYV